MTDQTKERLIKAIETTYFQHLVNTYAGWSTSKLGEDTTIRDRMLQEFTDGLHCTIGRNYIKVISGKTNGQKHVHSFVVLKPTKGFVYGDILKANGWNAPAKNFKRGNVFDLTSLPAIRWTGA